MSLYEYKVKEITTIIDGDTVACVIDLGFGLRSRIRVRLRDVDTPERGHPDWNRATAMTSLWLTGALLGGGWLHLATQKAGPSSTGIGDGAFGRWLGVFTREGDTVSLNQFLAAHGWGSNP